jgi:hypothetical protein
MDKKHLALALLAGALLAGASGATTLAPGMWEIMNRPGVATLDGRELSDLPLPELEPERLCLSAAQAADPATFLPGDTAEGCRITSASTSGGEVKIAGTCPSADGGKDGSLLLAGRYERDRYEVDFETVAYGNNGRMSFSGKLEGRRIGDCAPA